MKTFLFSVVVAVMGVTVWWQVSYAAPDGGITLNRVSVGNNEQQGNNISILGYPSDTGRYVLYTSLADNLVPGDTNEAADVFLRDTVEETTTRISLDTAGNDANDNSVATAMSPNGRYMIFDSEADDIVAADTNAHQDGFLYDRNLDTTTRVTIGILGVEGNEYSSTTAISPDGRWVAFISAADNLVAGDTNGQTDCFLRDRTNNATLRVVPPTNPNPDGPCTHIDVSDDGRFVAFESWASDLIPNDTNGDPDIFVMDLDTNEIRRISVDSAGTQADDDSFSPHLIRADEGFLVAYRSLASNLVPGDSNGNWDIYLYHVATGETQLGSLSTTSDLGNSDSWEPSLSEDGMFLVFFSDASNLVPNDTNNVADVFLRNLDLGITIRISLNANGVQGNNHSNYGIISQNGEAIAYTSLASNLVPNDSNSVEDVFLMDFSPESTPTPSPTATTTETATPTVTSTSTVIPPTSTPTVSATGTIVPPTHTPIVTITPTGTFTPPTITVTPTGTISPATRTPTSTPTIVYALYLPGVRTR